MTLEKTKPLRTALFVPGNQPDRIDKAVGLDADAVIIDLEDAVPLNQKVETRHIVKEKSFQYLDHRVFVRVNSLDSGLIEDDLSQIVHQGLSGIVFPKIDSREALIEINSLLLQIEKKSGIYPHFIEILALIESARGVQNIFEIVSTKLNPPRLLTVAFGSADYALDLGIKRTKDGTELDYARASIPIACRAARITAPIDTPYMMDLKDLDALKREALKAKTWGYQGKLVIHPNQIQPCNDIFSPSKEEINRARKVIEAFEKAEADGLAAIQLDGEFVDYAIVERSKKIMKLAELVE